MSRLIELSVGDVVFDPETGERGVVAAVERWPMTRGGTYWINVNWDNPFKDTSCLECHVRIVGGAK